MSLRKFLGAFVHLFIWSVIALVFYEVLRDELRIFHIYNGVQTIRTEVHGYLLLVVVGVFFKTLLFYANALPWQVQLRRQRRWPKYAILTGLTAIILICVEWLLIRLAGIRRPPFNAFIWTDILLFLLTICISLTYYLIIEWDEREKRSQQIAGEQIKAELNFLKEQINPHFFLNTLNNLYSMAQARDIEELEEGILQLSEMMRYMLYECQADQVPISKEIEYIKAYIALNLLRYRQDGSTSVRLNGNDAETSSVMIAPVILILFIENAFKHGTSTRDESVIDINIAIKDNRVLFNVKNTDHARENAKFNHKRIGMNNVKRRLEMLYPGRHTLQVIRNDNFYQVSLEINLK
jgi:two-component system LytT family sensor kinase